MTTRFAALCLVLLAATRGAAQEKEPELTPKQRSASKLAAQAAELMKKAEWDKGIRLCDAAL